MLKTCNAQGSDSKIMNRWKIEEASYINQSFRIPYVTSEEFMESQYRESVSNIRKFMSKYSEFALIGHRAA